MSSLRTPKAGRRIAHKTLDGANGTAFAGVVADVVGDDEQRLIVGRFPGEDKPVAFDAREVQPIVSLPGLDRGPVLLHPHHLWGLLRNALRFGR